MATASGLPSYDELYFRWEQSRWSATAIDFTADAREWRSELDDIRRTSGLWNLSMFLHGVRAVARALTAMVEAAPDVAHSTFLATQIADEARNRVFLDRLLREVAQQGHDPASTMHAGDRYLTWGMRQTIGELERVTDALRRKPRERPLLAQAVAVCHIVVEGVLAIPGEHFMQRYVSKQKILRGLSAGLEAITADEERHVAFGTRLLRELIASSAECRQATIDVWNRVLRPMVGVFIPPDRDPAYIECFDFTQEEIYAFGLRALESKMHEVGIDPEELYLLSLDDRSLGYEQRAHRMLVLVRAGILGDDRREPEPTREALEIIFDGTTRAIDVDAARSLGGPIEWAFTDTEPWHVVVVNGALEAKPGSSGAPALTLEMASGDWTKIAIGRADSRWALLTRRLRVHGHWHAKAKLAKLFN